MWLFLAVASRWLILVLSVCLPPAGFGLVAGGIWGAAIGALAGVGLLFTMAMISEQVVFNGHGAGLELPRGLERTYEQVLLRAGISPGSAPDLHVFPDPSPLAVVARNPGSQGTVLLSQGVLSTMSERDLRVLLTDCLRTVSSPWVPVATLAAVVALTLSRSVPEGWLRFLQPQDDLQESPSGANRLTLGVSGALRFLVVYPLVRFTLRVGGAGAAAGTTRGRKGSRVWVRVRHPALSRLYLPG